MGLFPNLVSKKRKTVNEPGGEDLFQGLIWEAVGLTGISFLTTAASLMWKIIFTVAGIFCCIRGGQLLYKYVSEYKAFKNYVPTWDPDRGIYDKFAQELNAWHQDDIVPSCCDADTLYFLRLQKHRLGEKGLKMTDQVMPVKGSGYGTATLSRKTLWYTSDMTYEDVNRKIRFENAQGILYEREVEQVMYEVIVHTPNDAEISHISMTCPNCGAVSPVAGLNEGCKYCGTRFRITDLFPRVVNLYFLKSSSTASNAGIVQRTIFFTMLAIFTVLFFFMILCRKALHPAYLAECFLTAGFCGGLLGLVLADIRLLLTTFDRDGMKHVSLLKWNRSRIKITNTMKQYDPNFSFDKFEGQIVALVRMAVFAQHPESLACYRGRRRDKRFSDILEMTYTNATCLNHMNKEGDILHISLRTWWINYSESGGKVQKTGDCIDVELSRNVTMVEPPEFSITSVECPNCRGSFDAVRQKACPFCGTEYHMENEGWVIDDMCLIR